MMGYWLGGMGWWMALAGLVCVAFWGGLIWLTVWGVNKIARRGNMSASNSSPLEIAKGRYARSEITKEQFDQIKKDIV
jgi:uncharacterized membrane protein